MRQRDPGLHVRKRSERQMESDKGRDRNRKKRQENRGRHRKREEKWNEMKTVTERRKLNQISGSIMA